jgi:hypothetical protein
MSSRQIYPRVARWVGLCERAAAPGWVHWYTVPPAPPRAERDAGEAECLAERLAAGEQLEPNAAADRLEAAGGTGALLPGSGTTLFVVPYRMPGGGALGVEVTDDPLTVVLLARHADAIGRPALDALAAGDRPFKAALSLGGRHADARRLSCVFPPLCVPRRAHEMQRYAVAAPAGPPHRHALPMAGGAPEEQGAAPCVTCSAAPRCPNRA